MATNLAGDRRAVATAVGASALLALLAIAGVYVVLRVSTARALRPVEAMSARAAEWSEHAGPDRIGTGQRYRELHVLARSLDALLDRLAAVVRHERRLADELSHELRTPISRILAETEGRPGSASIRDSAGSMLEIIETLLSAARVGTGSLPGTCSLTAVLAGLDAPVGSVAPDADTVGVDAAVAARVLAPILGNARRHARGQVTVEARRTGGIIAIDVANDGEAIPHELRERVFEPGFRAAPDDGHDGAGLGLALARRLARAADGDVTVVPAVAGTTVRILLPPG